MRSWLGFPNDRRVFPTVAKTFVGLRSDLGLGIRQVCANLGTRDCAFQRKAETVTAKTESAAHNSHQIGRGDLIVDMASAPLTNNNNNSNDNNRQNVAVLVMVMVMVMVQV